ncbi:MAG: 16S rRNA (cytosine(1402)-N(4))-methyltransferase RsmH [Alphaproteobacteria bacterium]|nr:16S rRNA (cytosine(1402)-N(4))-methyltransferase RsmH [Alphaproteobacteria bacterium]
MEAVSHIPVLLDEVLEYLNCRTGGTYIDGTFGAGGYTRAILDANANNHVIGFDRDPDATVAGLTVEGQYPNRFSFIHDCFGNMATYLDEPVDGIVLDLGVSSMQIDEPGRGFSFRLDGPLDMRMGQTGKSAKDYVNSLSEKELADIIFTYGEEKASRRIASAIVRTRGQHPIVTTAQLADIIHSVMPKPKDGSDSAMRTFQALRIYVNDELGELERALDAAVHLLKPNGRLVVVSFHSLEDRLVKNFLIHNSTAHVHQNRYAPEMKTEAGLFHIMTRKPVTPGDVELVKNPRSHSAKLRAAWRQA